MKVLRVGLATVLMVVMSACGSYLVKPESFSEKLAYVDGGITAVVNATATSLENQQISVDDAKRVRVVAGQAAAFSDAAKAAGEGPEGSAQLALATGLLTQLQSFLNTRSKQ